MVSAAADTQREIGEIRRDTSAALAELERRLGGGISGLTRTDAGSAGLQAGQGLSGRTRAAASEVREKPAARGIAGAAAIAALGYAAYRWVEKRREQQKPQNRVRRRAEAVRDDLEERLSELRERAREARKRGVLLRVEREGEDYLRVKEAKLDALQDEGTKSKVLKNLLWAGVLAVFMAIASVLARRMAGALWQATLREQPPTEKK